MARRRIIFIVGLLVISIALIGVWTVNDSVRNSTIQLGSDSSTDIAEATPEVTPDENGVTQAYPPSTLAFVGNTGNTWDIYSLDAEGTLLNLSAEGDAHDYFPSFAFDSSMINFISNRGDATELGPSQVLPDGSDLRSLDILGAVLQMVGEQRFDWDPKWSPNGEQLMWISVRDLNLEVYIIDLDEEFTLGNATRITRHGGRDWFPQWSPDGTQIAFISDREGNENIYTVVLDEGELVQLSDSEFDDLRPSWSLEGDTILYLQDTDDELAIGNLDFYLINTDGTDRRPLGDGQFAGSAVWSPDGRSIAYMSNESGQWQIYVMNVDGSNIRRVTPDDGDYLYPVWKP